MEKRIKEAKEVQMQLLGRIIGMIIVELFCIVCSAYLCSTGTILGWTLGIFMIFSTCVHARDVVKYIRAYKIGQKLIKLGEFVKQRMDEAEPIKLDELDKWDEK